MGLECSANLLLVKAWLRVLLFVPERGCSHCTFWRTHKRNTCFHVQIKQTIGIYMKVKQRR